MKTPLKLKIICHLQSLQRERKMEKELRKIKIKLVIKNLPKLVGRTGG